MAVDAVVAAGNVGAELVLSAVLTVTLGHVASIDIIVNITVNKNDFKIENIFFKLKMIMFEWNLKENFLKFFYN